MHEQPGEVKLVAPLIKKEFGDGHGLTLEAVCHALNSGELLGSLTAGHDGDDMEPIDWFGMAHEYAAKFEGPNKYNEHDSVEVMCPGITGQFLDVMLEAGHKGLNMLIVRIPNIPFVFAILLVIADSLNINNTLESGSLLPK